MNIRRRIISLVILIAAVFMGYSVVQSTYGKGILKNHPFRLGLDLSGGSHLLYKADISQLPSGQIGDSMAALRDVIERRVNIFGVGEPVVQSQTATLGGEKEYRLSVELPGVTDLSKAITMIGQTPFLEFKKQGAEIKAEDIKNGQINIDPNNMWSTTGLTGKYLKKATLVFNPNTNEPVVSLQFNDEGAKLFEQITKDNVGKQIAIFLDGSMISAPTVQEAITGGNAQISGKFTPEEARTLVGRLNSGALPVPISLISTQTVGATLGAGAVDAGMKAALLGFLIVALFLLVWYRLPGLIAIIALTIYAVITLTLYKLIPVTLTAAGIAGFIISIGMAVDANILIFERFREERRKGGPVKTALEAGFTRAWSSIRDANFASLIIAVILYWFGTSLIKGFALTFGLGVLVSLLSAITITRIFLRSLPALEHSRLGRFFFSSGFKK